MTQPQVNVMECLASSVNFVLGTLIAASLVVGCLIPSFYEWTGSNQSHSPPIVSQTGAALLGIAVVIWCLLPWMRWTDHQPPPVSSPSRYTIRTLLLATALIATYIASRAHFPLMASGILGAVTLCYAIRFAYQHPTYRWATVTLLSCLWLPFAWTILPRGTEGILLMNPAIGSGMPGIFPSLLVAFGLNQGPDNSLWLAALITCIEVLIGIWIIPLGPRRMIAYLVLVLLLSTVGSFALNSLVRA